MEPPQFGRMHLGDTGVHAPAIPLSFLRLASYVFYVYVMLYALHVLVEEHSGTNVLKGGECNTRLDSGIGIPTVRWNLGCRKPLVG